MQAFSLFLFQSIGSSLVLFLYYQLVLRKTRHHTFNRMYLLCSVSISLCAPFLDASWFFNTEHTGAALKTLVSSMPLITKGQYAGNGFATAISLLISAAISFLLLAAMASKIVWICRVSSKGKKTKMPGYTLIETSIQQAPFSFCNTLFWKTGHSITDENGQKVFTHELTHIRQKHTYDKLFTQVVCSLFWFNPIYWLIHRELSVVHEFLADAAAVKNGDTEAFAKMLLYAHNGGSYLSPAHAFFNSPIKRRLIMIESSGKKRRSFVSSMLALPFFITVIAGFSLVIAAQEKKQKQRPLSNQYGKKCR